MKTPLVSVCMPAYNAEKYIEESINSILSQSYNNFEFIIIDDQSTDSTWDIIQRYTINDKRIISTKNETNLGIAGNRNKLIKLAKGKYIVWQDADDISTPDRLRNQVVFMEENPSVGICGGWIASYKNGHVSDVRKYASDDIKLRKNIFRHSPVAQPASIIRKECFNKVGIYNLEYPPAEDIDMSFRIGAYYKFANLQEIVLKYREHDTSATAKQMRRIIKNTLIIRVENMKNKKYKFNIVDIIALMVTFGVQILPAGWITKLFKVLRG